MHARAANDLHYHLLTFIFTFALISFLLFLAFPRLFSNSLGAKKHTLDQFHSTPDLLDGFLFRMKRLAR